eukprot:Lankesteria_metandrocarpae@DN4920_c1_g1_i1.p2
METRVLSVQSHVVRGYVGNKSSVFPLQVQGFQVDQINSVHYASMYVHEGPVLQPAELEAVLRGLLVTCFMPRGSGTVGANISCNEEDLQKVITDHDYILTGYVGDGQFLKVMKNFIQNQKKLRTDQGKPQLKWICDPVMGDNGHLYVSDCVRKQYTEIIELADVVTPNHHELQWLCGHDATCDFERVEDVLKLCEHVHSMGPRVVVVTSVPLKRDSRHLYLVGSEKIEGGGRSTFKIRFRRREVVYLGGTGDLMAAMLLSSLHRKEWDLKKACEEALTTVQAVMAKTLASYESPVDVNVVASLSTFLKPNSEFEAEDIFEFASQR